MRANDETLGGLELEAMQRRAEELERLFTQLDREVAEVRGRYVAHLEADVMGASRAGDLKLEASLNRKIAAVFAALNFAGEAERYRARAKDCSDRLRRRTWVENQTRGGSKR
jgi:hypothetical protein